MRFVLPDYGALRQITLCAIDENSKPLAGAIFRSSFLRSDPEDPAGEKLYDGMASELFAGANGCIHTEGYTRVSYSAEVRIEPKHAQILARATTVIDSGTEPVHQVLKLSQK